MMLVIIKILGLGNDYDKTPDQSFSKIQNYSLNSSIGVDLVCLHPATLGKT